MSYYQKKILLGYLTDLYHAHTLSPHIRFNSAYGYTSASLVDIFLKSYSSSKSSIFM